MLNNGFKCEGRFSVETEQVTKFAVYRKSRILSGTIAHHSATARILLCMSLGFISSSSLFIYFVLNFTSLYLDCLHSHKAVRARPDL